MRILRNNKKEIERLFHRFTPQKKRVTEGVRNILEKVRVEGDKALVAFTKKFDKVCITPPQLKITEREILDAYHAIRPDFVKNLKAILENVTAYYVRQKRKSWKFKTKDGVLLGEKIEPLESVGVYIPAGSAPLISTVYMTVLPAQIAGVKRIALVSPPQKDGNIDPHILVVANLLKIKEMYKIGGAQAIAALAYGTKTIPKVDKIVGPGNEYVSEAKRQVFGNVDIDMIAGPSEVVVIANRYSNPQFVIKELQAQAEHRKGLAILITTSKMLAKTVKNKVGTGYIILAKNTEEAIYLSNKIAPEHLHIMINKPERFISSVRHAGAIFVGQYTPVALGDYVAGPSHVLPTSGTARFFSGLGINDFVKSSHIISYSKKALEKVAPIVENIAKLEGLVGHWESVETRLH